MSNSQISEKINEIIETAKQLEVVGKYTDAAAVLSPFWSDVNELPNTSSLNIQEHAEIHLRCGSLVGFIGGCNQTLNSQELAKNLLTEARDLFLSLEIIEKVAECETYLAATYLRIGEIQEAKSWLNTAFHHKLNENSETRLYTHLIQGIALLADKNHDELIEKYEQIEKHFRSSFNYALQGGFNNNYAVALMRLGKREKAVERFDLAKFFYGKIGHHLYLGIIENNLAGMFQIDGKCEEAHKYILSALSTFQSLGDKNREGYSFDTRSQIFMSEGRYKEALECSNQAVKLLESGENYCYLANSMQTKSHIEFYLKDYANSLKTMIGSVNIASLHISQTQADKFREDYAVLLKTLESK
jgi:tetratricopeptide (TPR) repeat protein